MDDYFDPDEWQREIDRLKAERNALVKHCCFPIRSKADLTDAEKDAFCDVVAQAAGDAFFRAINSLETDLNDFAAGVIHARQRSDTIDIRGRQ